MFDRAFNLKLLSANISMRLENVLQLFPHVLTKEKKRSVH